MTIETTMHFIQLYKEHECLWNTRSPTYENKQMREAALDDIKTKMNIDGFGIEEIRAKVRVLRSTYYQEKKKIQNSQRSGAGANEIHRPNIQWYSDMDEIMQKIESKTPTWDNLENQDQTGRGASSTQPANILPQQETVEASVKSPKSKKSKLNELVSIVQGMQALNENMEETEFDIFGSSVAAQLKKLSESQAIIAQEQIQPILTKCRLNDVRGRSQISSIQTLSTPSSTSASWSPQEPLSPSPQFSTYSGEPIETTYGYNLNASNYSRNESQQDIEAPPEYSCDREIHINLSSNNNSQPETQPHQLHILGGGSGGIQSNPELTDISRSNVIEKAFKNA